MFKDLKIGECFFKSNHNGTRKIIVENIYEDNNWIEINVVNCFSYAYGKSNKCELLLNKKNNEHLLRKIIRKKDAIIDEYYTLSQIDFEDEESDVIEQFEQCNICGLTDDHSIGCTNNNSPFNELITNGYD